MSTRVIDATTPSPLAMAATRQANVELQELYYMNSPDLTDGSAEITKSKLNLKATELRLGLPGSRSPERSHEKSFFPLHPIASVHSATRNKRGFSDAMDEVTHSSIAGAEVPSRKMSSGKETEANKASSVAKEQVVGWPPIRSFRKNSLATSCKNKDGGESGSLFVKVSMCGAPYLRKIDLAGFATYRDLSSALEKMFSFRLGQYGGHDAKTVSESKLKDMLRGSEYVLTYEDKDGDWMLVGDVPWHMFIAACNKLRIMKSSDAIGLAPRSVDNIKFHS